MKKLIPILILFFSLSTFAQGGDKMKERIKAQKIAFISDQLDLSEEEAQGFWPIYNAYEDTVEGIRSSEIRTVRMKIRQNPDMSEAEANQLISQLIKAEENILAAKIKLVNDLKKVLSSVKILKLRAVEDQFNKRLLDKLKEFREQRRNRKN
ncbi:sensor of ECF-type sigma factor [Winogradskyella sp.]|uniref:sensor of ECF-type sigma factor n=1 Tax=Winogradskyella sp. TaxID=1883156 RepID=UPI002639C43F|nr:sensor of ECF-type sigma factor [Winogradskyella sp.]